MICSLFTRRTAVGNNKKFVDLMNKDEDLQLKCPECESGKVTVLEAERNYFGAVCS